MRLADVERRGGGFAKRKPPDSMISHGKVKDFAK